MSAARYPDWQLRLQAFAQSRDRRPFAWGLNDCATFAADGVQALTGVQLLPDLRGHCTARQALAALRQLGGLCAIATRALGPPISPRRANIGDVILLPMGKREALGLCNGITVLGPGRDGMVAISMRLARLAWRVG